MKPVFQTRFDSEGNCWPACIASMLELSISETDHLACDDHPGWIKKTDDFLKQFGLFHIEIPRDANGNFATSPFPDGSLVILRCKGASGLPHVVIGRIKWTKLHPDGQCAGEDFEIVHDPAPRKPKEYDVDSIIVFCRLFT